MRVIESFSRGLKMLDYLAAAEHGVKVADIAAAFGMPSSNMSLFLNSLVSEGYAVKNPENGRYHLSQKLSLLSQRKQIDIHGDLKTIAHPELERLHRMFDENVLLGVLQDNRVTFLIRLQSHKKVQIVNSPEEAFLPHVTAAGKAILGNLKDHEIEAYLKKTDFKRFTPKTLTHKTEILKELTEVRKRGFAVNRGEYEKEIMAVAAPIFSGDTLMASITVQFPTSRFHETDLFRHATEVMRAAKRIRQGLEKIR